MLSSRIFLSYTAALIIAGCNRSSDAPRSPPADPARVAAPTPPPTPPTPPTPEGPTQDLRGDEYQLAVALIPPTGTSPGSFKVEVRGVGDYHVNEAYPIAVEAAVERGGLAKTSLRRADATEFSTAVARFEQPLTVSGPGARVHGTVRFGVCRAEQCAFFNRAFAVAIP